MRTGPVVVVVAACLGCGGGPVPLEDGTDAMVERLAAIDLRAMDAAAEPDSQWRINRPWSIDDLREQARTATDPSTAVRRRIELAQQLLFAGRSREALDEMRALVSSSAPVRADQRASVLAGTARFVGIAGLRLAEQENCVGHHTAESCLFPLEGGAVHTERAGAEQARRAFEQLLQVEPDALDGRWLLNLAAMALGEWPDGVPERWRLEPALFASAQPFPRLVNVAISAGVAEDALAGGCAVEDLDGDGDLDIVASSWGLRDSLKLFVNRGDGTFDDRSAAAGLDGITGGLNLTHADYDGDGDVDLLVLRGGWLGPLGEHPNSLLRNDGDGTFSDVTVAAGLYDEAPSQTAAWADIDLDGDLDLFVGNEHRDADRPYPSRLYRNDGGRFVDVAADAGIVDAGFVKGATFGDYDDDGYPDLYLSRIGAPNRLLRNTGDGRFTDVTETAGVASPIASFPTWFFDYDNDGREDLFVAAWDGAPVSRVAAAYLGRPHGAETPRLYRNRGDGGFDDVSDLLGTPDVLLTMGANFGDLDGDGWLDLYLGTGAPDLATLMPNRLLRNDGGLGFVDVTTAAGLGHLQKGHGIGVGDIDADGDQDLYAVMGGWFTGDHYPNALFLNPGNGHGSVTLRLRGTRSNRFAVGARLRLDVVGPGGRRSIHRTVSTGGSFGGSSLQQEVGLGDAERIERLEVRWPARNSVQTFDGLEPGAVYTIVEGAEEPQKARL